MENSKVLTADLPDLNKSWVEIPLSDPPSFNGITLKAFLSTKSAGDVRKLSENGLSARESFFYSAGIEESKVFSVKQVHSKKVIKADSKSDTTGVEADGIITGAGLWVVTVTVADCMPVFIFDRKSGSFGLLHSGWKGTGILKNGVELLKKEYGSDANNISVTLGPSIGSCCYDVDWKRYSLFRKLWGENSVQKRDEKLYLDLRAANLTLAGTLGISDAVNVSVCTSCTGNLGSFRREKEEFHSMAAIIGYMNIKENNSRF